MRGIVLIRGFQRAPRYPVGRVVKRGFDLAGASLVLVLLSPLFLLICILVMVADRGSPFQTHPRVGRGGRVFSCLEFRTTSETMNSAQATAARTSHLPLVYESYLTPVGAVLVKLGLNELPRIINILRGDMSIVGTRPLAPGEPQMCRDAADFYGRLRPGLVGPCASRSENGSDAGWTALERRDVENWSLVADLRIIVKTVSAICFSRGG
ncbi:sugar transferase [Sinorhizobium fredii]|nr:sugar transferase [Sinorhizobium fredii]